MLDPAEARVQAELDDPGFIAGAQAGRWRIHAFAFPRLDFYIAATEPDGRTAAYGFRGDVTNFPATKPNGTYLGPGGEHAPQRALAAQGQSAGRDHLPTMGRRYRLPALGSHDRPTQQQCGQSAASCLAIRSPTPIHFRGHPWHP